MSEEQLTALLAKLQDDEGLQEKLKGVGEGCWWDLRWRFGGVVVGKERWNLRELVGRRDHAAVFAVLTK
jgi:hypothetical protein